MNLVIASRWYPPESGYGGIAAYNHHLAHALAQLGHSVTVIAARWSKNDPAAQQDGPVSILRLYLPSLYRINRLPLMGRFVRPLQQWLYSQRIYHAVKALKNSQGVDILEFADANAEGYATIMSRFLTPVVVRCHTPTFVLKQYYRAEEWSYDTSITIHMEKACIKRASALSAPSQNMANLIGKDCNMPADKIVVIPNPVDITQYRPKDLSSSHGKNDKQVRILHVGRMDRVKGVDFLVQAIPQVLKNAPEAQFIFAGKDRGYQKHLENELDRSGISRECVSFLGNVSHADLLGLYQQADIAVVPTINYESFSYTCAQAMAAGLPLIASRIGGIPETLGVDGGILVEPGDASALACEIIHMVKNRDLRVKLGKLARSRAETYFAAPIVAKKTIDFYRSIQTNL